MDTTSYWIDSAPLPQFPALEANLDVDVIIIGGGIMGITAAYLLKQEGKTVALLERARLASIDTGHTTAHLTAVVDQRYHDLKGNFGKDAARAVWDASSAAIDQIVRLIRAEDIACDFRWVPAYLHLPKGERDEKPRKELEKEIEALRELEIRATLEPAIPFFETPGIKYPSQALFHPRKYLAALAKKIPGGGSHVFEHSEVTAIEDDPIAVKTEKGKIRGRYLIIATHTPLTGNTSTTRALLFQTKLALYTSYALGAKIPAGLIPTGSYYDTAEPYNYLRVEPRRGHDYAIWGGQDHKTGQEEDTHAPYHRLEKSFLRLVPEAEIDHRWSGQVIDTNDGLPFIGETAEHQFAATGFSGNGMTFGTLSAMMAADAALGRKFPWAKLFEVHRAKIKGGTWSYLQENKDYPYYMLRDWVGGSEGNSLRVLQRGHGKILHLDGKKVAAYRGDDGNVSLCSPVCTHLKCIVAWNDAEKTWDCPCHGSRFTPAGEVISGPAEQPLEKLRNPGTDSD